ncbi:MAG: PPOX class F420-dependent oxidoreductase [Streptosporangiaceae bacterium]
MSERHPETDHPCELEVNVGYFAPLASAKQLQLTTFERNGMPASAPVPAVVDGDRAYFSAWSGSDSARRLRRMGAVQVARCSMRGLLIYGPPLDAAARRLPTAEARQVAGTLARRHPIRHRFVIPLLRRTRRQRLVHYELLADAVADSGE